jgi:replicative DNA helicase
MSAPLSPPFSAEAEGSVVGQMLSNPSCIGEVTATLLEASHFHLPANRILYGAIVDSHFGDLPIDPLTIAEACAVRLATIWSCDEPTAVQRAQDYAVGRTFQGDPASHAMIVKRHADLRALLDLSESIKREVGAESMSPDEIAGMASSTAMKIATDAVVSHEIVSFADAGRRFIAEMKRRVALKQAGVDIGAKFGISAVDLFTMGLQPTELLVAGGEPGVGKSAAWWAAAMNFAEGQSKRVLQPDERPVGTLILSLEMGDLPSSSRQAQGMTGIDGAHMREGDLDQAMLRKIISEWGARKNYPLWMNYASGLRLSQLRAMISEAIRKHNVGLVIIDHFLLLFPDRHMDTNEADTERVVFLKNAIAKDLNVAVVCLAHTRKAIERADKRPRLADLRGAGTIAAFADFVALMFRPWQYASDKDKDGGKVSPTDAEMIWAKNRHGIDGTGNFYFDPSRMAVV